MKLRGIVWGVDLLLLAAGALLAAQIAEAFSLLPAGPVEAADPGVPDDGARSVPPPPPDPQVIVERNLFAPATGASPRASQEPAEELEESELPLVLVGTVAAEDPALSQAAVRDVRNGETRVIGPGDALAPDATAVRIERRRLILEEGGDHRELRIADWDPGTIRQRARRKRARAKRVVEKYRKYYANKGRR
jgi:hypothetical protein